MSIGDVPDCIQADRMGPHSRRSIQSWLRRATLSAGHKVETKEPRCAEQDSAGRKLETSESLVDSAVAVLCRERLPAGRKSETSESPISLAVLCRPRRSAGRTFETSESQVKSTVARRRVNCRRAGLVSAVCAAGCTLWAGQQRAARGRQLGGSREARARCERSTDVAIELWPEHLCGRSAGSTAQIRSLSECTGRSGSGSNGELCVRSSVPRCAV